MMKFVVRVALLPALFCAAANAADEPRSAKADETETLNDRTFIEKATVGGMFEVMSSQLAKEKAGNSTIKDFAARMIADHTKASRQLTALAGKKDWILPKELDPKHKELIAKLEKGELGRNDGGGADGSVADRFDRAYMEMQVVAHDKTVALFEKAARDVQDPDLKAWAVKTLPTLKEHQKLARELNTRGAHPTNVSSPPVK